MSWLKSNTFHHSDFADLEALCQKKEEQNLKISLCIPTLNEEATIGKVVVILKSELMDRFPLVDEIAVIDSGSTDRTGEVAESFGAEFYYSGDILPSEGFKAGKGENLWKAIHQLKGDVIAYVDADIANIHPRFVYGLIGPLLEKPEVSYVKAFYERPLAFSQGIRPTGGGRVTEILVRPLFSLFYPELTQLFQPLSGEYAVRRKTLERIPFPIGYGVETSHILDVYKDNGMSAFAQVDLDQRIHRNQDTIALGKMSFGILQSFLGRLQDHGKVSDLAELSSIYRSLQANGTEYEQIEKEILEEERPPIETVAEYRKKFPAQSG